MIKALLFDLDGTLIDSEHFHFECWNEILAGYGGALTFDDWQKNYAGVPLPVNAGKLIQKFHITTPHAELVERRESLSLDLLASRNINFMPFAVETLEFFKQKGLTLALVTSSTRPDVEAIFNRNGLGKFFKLIITRTEVTNSKPHPECYELCVDLLGVKKEECIVFEDTINGARSAKAAGLVCYAIQSNTAEHEKLAIADKLFLDLDEAKRYLLDNKLIV